VTTTLIIPNESVDSWLAVLKPYQRDTLKIFLETRTPEAAAEEWLTKIGLSNISSFGGGSFELIDTKPFWIKFKIECRKFLCDENSYTEEKKGLMTEGNMLKTALISAMSGALGAKLGTAATLLAPAITLMLVVIGKMSINAYCALEQNQ
jgi:hypothetical protein